MWRRRGHLETQFAPLFLSAISADEADVGPLVLLFFYWLIAAGPFQVAADARFEPTMTKAASCTNSRSRTSAEILENCIARKSLTLGLGIMAKILVSTPNFPNIFHAMQLCFGHLHPTQGAIKTSLTVPRIKRNAPTSGGISDRLGGGARVILLCQAVEFHEKY